nr:immunoglobulin light chain junction region [Macaca mulatta]MOW36395.1 immunoglobulin light chain junction region [Macaca mulatta]MOW36853.1 immunoglobulin light chain junction region [Macaca mulatta]MOW36993.1 immunoglobulin light chain junction region [Macaca mulatta]MOW37864.1 immunoglobulin light chain junction region [Macaca mulatta]
DYYCQVWDSDTYLWVF